MNTYELLSSRIDEIKSLLCIGLDPDISLLNALNLNVDNLFELNKLIIDSSYEFASAFKLQFAHYSALAKEDSLQRTCEYIKKNYSNIPVILDSKRSDIGNTATKYAIESFKRYNADAVTVNPYIGLDTLDPFLSYKDKAIIVLIKTSNLGSSFIQDLQLKNNQKVYEYIAQNLSTLYSYEQLWFVVGGTDTDAIKNLRKLCPDSVFLIPGVGAQGANISDILRYALPGDKKRVLINISRGITDIDNKKINNLDLDKYITQVKNKSEKYYLEIRNNLNY